MHCCEALDFPLRSMHTKSHQAFKVPYCDSNNIGQFARGVGRSPWEILSRIEEYSTKFLTNPSDILNGMLGILRAFEQIHGVRHIFGVPILPQPAGIKRQINRKEESSVWDSQIGFALGLCWDLEDRSTWLRRHPAPSDRRTLICWDLNDQSTWQRRNPGPSDRRVGFPSWSWTGWFGLANWESTDKDTVWIDAGFRVKFELCDGQVIEWPTFHASYDKFSDCSAISQYIIISAWTTRVTFLGHRRRNTRDANSTFCVARIELEDGGYLLWEFSATTKENFSPDKEYLGIHLVDHEPDPDSKTIIFRGPALLVVSKVEDRMERVGFGWVTDSKYEVYGADWEQYSVDSDSMLSWSEDRPRMVKVWQEIRLG
jgi:hypothetical protein